MASMGQGRVQVSGEDTQGAQLAQRQCLLWLSCPGMKSCVTGKFTTREQKQQLRKTASTPQLQDTYVKAPHAKGSADSLLSAPGFLHLIA